VISKVAPDIISAGRLTSHDTSQCYALQHIAQAARDRDPTILELIGGKRDRNGGGTNQRSGRGYRGGSGRGAGRQSLGRGGDDKPSPAHALLAGQHKAGQKRKAGDRADQSDEEENAEDTAETKRNGGRGKG
jgi:hypothetical protein